MIHREIQIKNPDLDFFRRIQTKNHEKSKIFDGFFGFFSMDHDLFFPQKLPETSRIADHRRPLSRDRQRAETFARNTFLLEKWFKNGFRIKR